ncbi:cystathionine gamma-synthase [Geopyxis carbonaria]|nr:cystathionine gamma-synthase [Geopyxis carbonaria]
MATELGHPIPKHPYAVSVSIPTWKTNMAYGRKEAWVMDSLQTGYPRFCIPRNIESFASVLLASWNEDPSTRAAMLFPSSAIAHELVDFLELRDVVNNVRVVDVGAEDVHAVVYPKEHFPLAKSFWQHTGEGISGRRCDAARKQWELRHEPPTPPAEDAGVEGDWAKDTIRARISELAGAGTTEEDVWLFPSGMSAMFNTHKMLRKALGERKAVSFGFPYVDTLKILAKWGPGAVFYGHGSSGDLDTLEARLVAGERFLALFCETPSNPLLRSPDLLRICRLAKTYDFAVVVDETIGNFVNVDVLPHVDVIVTSLTKAFSGACNVMGGSMVLNPKGRYYTRFTATMTAQYADTWYPLDAVILELNSRTFSSRVPVMSSNATALAALLSSHPLIRIVHHPSLPSPSQHHYQSFRRPSGGYGFLLSFYFHDEEHVQPFLDAIDTPKGPSLGTNFTLVSPYTILSHFGELEWAEEFGVKLRLVRVSVGLEERGELLEKFRKALEAIPLAEEEEIERGRTLKRFGE